MFIDQLNQFLQEASALPISLWEYRYQLARKSFFSQAEAIARHINARTRAGKALSAFVNILRTEELDELALAKSLSELSEIFSLLKVKNDKLESYKELSRRFVQRAQLHEFYKKKREGMKKKLSEKEQKEFDIRLFEKEGTSYVLEYYLAVYKTLIEKKNQKEKSAFLEAKEINLGFGGTPGLKQDFVQNESLTKFILLILDDRARVALEEYYYHNKATILKEIDLQKIEGALKEYILNLLYAFEKRGVVQLTSIFFAPYGQKPHVRDLIKEFTS